MSDNKDIKRNMMKDRKVKNNMLSKHKKHRASKSLIKKFYKILLVPIVLIALHYNFYYTTAHIVKADQSVNPKATNYFIHANVVSTLWINILHNYLFVDYDSFIMKPLLNLTNYLFEKGEENIKPNNAEDAVWWFLTYAYIYNINESSRKDNSMDIYDLPKDKEMSLRYKLADYIIKIGNYGVKGVEFGKYESSAMHALFAVALSNINIDKHYSGKNIDKVDAFWKDKKLYRYRVATYNVYKKYSKKDKYIQSWYLYSLNSLSQRLWYLVVKDIHNGTQMTNCKNRYITEYTNTLEELFENLNKKYNIKPHKMIQKNFRYHVKNDILVLNILKNSCKEYDSKIEYLKKLYKGVNDVR